MGKYNFKTVNKEKINNKQGKQLAFSIIKQLGLQPEILDLYPSEISGGMQKRVAIARAICGNPKILLFDEPTSGLDPVTGSLIDELIKTAVKTVGGSAITITHDMASVCRIADKVILIDKQTISWTGTPKEMFNSANKKIQEFIKPINSEIFLNDKIQKQFICQSCGNIYSRWIGKCEQCNQWNTIVEENNSKPSGVLSKSTGKK